MYFRLQPEIEFRDVDDFTDTVYTYSVEPHKLGCLYALPSNILFYEDCSKRCSVVRAIDCNFMPPKEVHNVTPMKVGDKINHMCLLQNSKQLLITVHGSCCTSLVQAHDIVSGDRKWIVNVTPFIQFVSHIERIKVGDGPCHFLLCGSASQVQNFSADGEYLGGLVTNGVLYSPRKMR